VKESKVLPLDGILESLNSVAVDELELATPQEVRR